MEQLILIAGLVMLAAFAVATWFSSFHFGIGGLFGAHIIVLFGYMLFTVISAGAGVYVYDGALSLIGLAIQAFLINCLLLPIGLVALFLRRPPQPHMLEAPSEMFDRWQEFFDNDRYVITLRTEQTVVRGVRQKDAVCYDITDGPASAELWIERRLGNPTMMITVVPASKSGEQRDREADHLASRIIECFTARGARVF